MPHEVIPIDRIRKEAIESAQRFANVNDACPYPFNSDAGRIFKQEFFLAREAKEKGQPA